MAWKILCGDVREKLAEIPDGSVQCCVTSPPYFGLRDYGMDGQLGLEATPEQYVTAIASLFGENGVKRILADDGTLWLNIGDSYAGSWGAQGRPQGSTGEMAGRSVISARQIAGHPKLKSRTGTIGADWGCKPKDLIGIPWTIAFALRQRGWYLRSDIIWAKPNPMPESIQDRPTKAHEYVFLFSKSERYFYDAAAIAEPLSEASITRYQRAVDNAEKFDPERHKHATGDPFIHRSPMQVLTEAAARVVERGTRNKRSVWTIPTQPYAAAHFATFPEELPETCIKAGSRPGDLILDPFCGAGTTLLVADRLHRDAIGIELNPEYV